MYVLNYGSTGDYAYAEAQEVAESESSSSDTSNNEEEQKQEGSPPLVGFNYRTSNMISTMNNYNLEASKETFTIPTPPNVQTPPIHPPAIKEIIQNTISDPTTTTTWWGPF